MNDSLGSSMGTLANIPAEGLFVGGFLISTAGVIDSTLVKFNSTSPGSYQVRFFRTIVGTFLCVNLACGTSGNYIID